MTSTTGMVLRGGAPVPERLTAEISWYSAAATRVALASSSATLNTDVGKRVGLARRGWKPAPVRGSGCRRFVRG